MKLAFVHGWSVTDTDTYGWLPQALVQTKPQGLDIEVRHIHLSKYISFHDEVTLEDISRAFEKARLEVMGNGPFSCITHSTGGPVIRLWADLFYGAGKLDKLPLKHLVMLAPANHGSALAQLGKGRLSRINSWFQGVEPGEKVLNWLELGSKGQTALNESCIKYKPSAKGFFPFVLTGQDIDKNFYDYLNPYLKEKGSDGVVRACAANMNYRQVRLRQDPGDVLNKKTRTSRLTIINSSLKSSPQTPFGVLPGTSHSGKKMGIMYSVKHDNVQNKPVVKLILECLKVKNALGYNAVAKSFSALTKFTQGKGSRFSMLVFCIEDDRGNPVEDFDMFLLGGEKYHPGLLPSGFFMDKQRNRVSPNHLTYYVDADKMRQVQDGRLGIRIVARPDSGFSYYTPAEFRSDGLPLNKLIVPNQTVIVKIELKRHVDKNVFRLVPLKSPRGSFSKTKPSGEDI